MLLLAMLALASTSIQDSVAAKIVWHDALQFRLEGKAWSETKGDFDRLPAAAESTVRAPVWDLSRDSAGLSVHFVTDATRIEARWSLRTEQLALPHMAATGVSGLDLYVKLGQAEYRWLGVGKPNGRESRARLVQGISPEMREYILYLPLYNGVRKLEIGVPEAARIEAAPARPPERSRPIVFYGTSITQGACASRPGMAHVALVGRMLDRPVLNLGFSGNGKMEPEMAQWIREIDAAAYVIDCLPNMRAELVRERVRPFVRILRDKRPTTPILLVEDRTYANAFLVTAQQERNARSRAALRAEYGALQAAGARQLFYMSGEQLLGSDGEATVDSSHPTDLGFLRFARRMRSTLKPILAD